MIQEVIVAKWLDADKTTLLARVKDENGTVTDQNFRRGTAEFDTVTSMHDMASIDKVTEEQNTVQQQNQQQDQQKNEAQRLEEERRHHTQKLFEAKIEAFEIPEIRNSSNRVLRSRLRKAAGIIEVTAVAALILQEELNTVETKTANTTKKTTKKKANTKAANTK